MKKILLIEDNEDVRETTAEILELADYDVLTAENGKIGVELAKTNKPELIICDIMMPDLDGYGVLRILSKNTETANIPFIFLTAKAEKSDMRKGMNMGADDYITKPFEEAELLEAIETRLIRSANLRKDFKGDLESFNQFIDEARGINDLSDLPKDRKTKEFNKKEAIFRENDFANYLYFVTKGKVKCFKTDEYGKELVTDLYGPGDFIGYMSLLEDTDYNETAIAMEATEVAIIPKHDFLSLLQKNRDVANQFIKMLAGNVLEKENRLLQLAYAPVRERVANALLKLIAKENDSVKLKISREDLASIVGTAKESLIRMLSEMKKEGLIESEGQTITIMDQDGLKRAASGF